MFRINQKSSFPTLMNNRDEGTFSVRMEGLEPPCLAALDPKSSASTNSATSAETGRKFSEYYHFEHMHLGV